MKERRSNCADLDKMSWIKLTIKFKVTSKNECNFQYTQMTTSKSLKVIVLRLQNVLKELSSNLRMLCNNQSEQGDIL